MNIKWFGNASFLLKTQGKMIYIDPYSGEYSEKADVVLISHDHRDHCDLDKLLTIRDSTTTILTCETCAKSIPKGNVKTLSPGDKMEFNGVTVYAVEAYNFKRFRSPNVPYHPKGTQIGFIIESEGKRLYHVGDSDYLPSMNEYENISVAFLPIMGRATMDIDEAADAAIGIKPNIAIPIHWRGSDPMIFKEKVESKSNIKVVVLQEGEELTL